MIAIAILCDTLAIIEVVEFSDTWDASSFYISGIFNEITKTQAKISPFNYCFIFLLFDVKT